MEDRILLRQVYGETLVRLGRERDDFVTLDADMCGATFVEIFRSEFPERHIRCGIAEQNMMCVAAGISTTGLISIVNTMAVFAAMRAVEQFRTSIAYPRFNIKVVTSHQGIDVGKDGPTHQCCEDIAIMRAIPNTVILAPADPIELEAMVRFMLDYQGPVYLRTGRSPVPRVFRDDYQFCLGCWPIIREGKDVTIVACGTMVEKALEAAKVLSEQSISAQVINASTIKPVGEEDFIESVLPTGAVVTVEDHTIMGGIGTLVSDILCKHHPMPVEKIGLNDCFAESGTPEQLFEKYGMTVEEICRRAKHVIGRKH